MTCRLPHTPMRSQPKLHLLLKHNPKGHWLTSPHHLCFSEFANLYRKHHKIMITDIIKITTHVRGYLIKYDCSSVVFYKVKRYYFNYRGCFINSGAQILQWQSHVWSYMLINVKVLDTQNADVTQTTVGVAILPCMKNTKKKQTHTHKHTHVLYTHTTDTITHSQKTCLFASHCSVEAKRFFLRNAILALTKQ